MSSLDKRAGEAVAFAEHCEQAFHLYRMLLAQGWPKELARGVLPFTTYSHMFTTMNLRNLFQFLTLRLDSHAQYEIRVYAQEMLKLAKLIVPECCAAFEEGLA